MDGAAWDLTCPDGRADTLVVCVPGGGMPRSTFDLHVPGRDGYSMVRWLVARGLAVATVDLHAPDLDPDVDGIDAAADHLTTIVDQLAGSWRRVIGLGHSLGAGVVAAAQARSRRFDRLALLGWSPRWTSLGPTPDRPSADDVAALRRWTSARLRALDPERWAHSLVRFPMPPCDPFAFRPDVPHDVIALVRAQQRPVPRALAVDHGIVEPALAAAAAIDVPVLLAFGEVDASDDPSSEHRCYPASPHVTTIHLKDSAHLHHVASTRHTLWSRIAAEATRSACAREGPCA